MEWMTAVRVVTESMPTVEADDDGQTFTVEFGDAGVSVRLNVAQLDALVSRALDAKMVPCDEDEDRREMAAFRLEGEVLRDLGYVLDHDGEWVKPSDEPEA